MRFRTATAVLAVVGAALGAPAAHAITVKAGKWDLTFNGNVNAHYIYSECEKHPSIVAGGLACVASNSSSAVSNGLLPAALTIGGSTVQSGYDIGFTFGLYPGISTNDGGSPNLQSIGSIDYGHTALGTAGLDVRQAFLTVGNKSMGTIMAGRNIGLFASDAILNDMTLLGVGAGNGNYASPANTSLGSIGLGYIYTDWLSQIDYTTPTMHGANATVGIFDPLNTLGQVPANHSSPGLQAKVTYTAGPLYLSASGLYQQQRVGCSDPSLSAGACGLSQTNLQYSSAAFDIGGKYTSGPFQVMGWYYRGSGVGTTGLFVLSNDSLGHPRDSEGFIAQATYTVGKTKFGLNYGESKLDPTTLDRANGSLVEMNNKWTAGIYHHLTPLLMLVGEFSRIQSTNDAGQKNSSWNVNAGLFLSF
ncbi:MAG: porin [Steroidobacteraceae bacterium]